MYKSIVYRIPLSALLVTFRERNTESIVTPEQVHRKHPSPSAIEEINVWYQGRFRGLDVPVVRRDGSFSTMPPGSTA